MYNMCQKTVNKTIGQKTVNKTTGHVPCAMCHVPLCVNVCDLLTVNVGVEFSYSRDAVASRMSQQFHLHLRSHGQSLELLSDKPAGMATRGLLNLNSGTSE